MTAIDSRELREFEAVLGSIPARASLEVERSVFRGATQIKETMQRDAYASKHFKGIAPSIDFDILSDSSGVAAEIGPRVGPGEAGNLGVIGYFVAYSGNSRGAGHAVRDPQAALDEEAPKFEAALLNIVGDSL